MTKQWHMSSSKLQKEDRSADKGPLLFRESAKAGGTLSPRVKVGMWRMKN